MQEKPKLKHNKKRNTAFLYEALVRELTKATVEKNENVKKHLVSIIKEFFSSGKPLARELDVYRSLYESKNLEKDYAKAIIDESKRVYLSFSQNDIFNEQSRLISKVNKTVGKSAFQAFMPNYKNLATISQIFDLDVPLKTRIILEKTLLEYLVSPNPESSNLQTIDNLVFKTFINKFNEKYGDSLLEEQKTLLTNYILAQDGVDLEFKIYLNEEVGRLKNIIILSNSIKNSDNGPIVSQIFESLKERKIDNKYLEDILYLQVLAKEIENGKN
jgi:hypothetical protein